MPLAYTYPDAYLFEFCTEDRETRALADVDLMAGGRVLSDEWTERLAITQTYILAATENQAGPDDLFAAKLKSYRQQLQLQIPQAIAAADAAAEVEGAGLALFSIPLERA
jgi:hypothetical protein